MKVLIDCGFHRGLVSERFLSENPDSRVFAFEPNIAIAHRAVKDLSARFPDRLTFHESAVWTKEGVSCPFFIGKGDQQGSSLFGNKRNLSRLSVNVKTVCLSDFVKNLYCKDSEICLKLDIEGAEYPVLMQMVRDGTLMLISELTVEFHSRKIGDGTQFAEEDRFLRQYLTNQRFLKKCQIYH